MFRRRTRAVEGVRCRELAQSSGMLIELIMLSAVVMVGIALLVSDSIKRVYSIPRSMKVVVRAHHTTRYVPGLAPSIPVGLIPTDIEVAGHSKRHMDKLSESGNASRTPKDWQKSR